MQFGAQLVTTAPLSAVRLSGPPEVLRRITRIPGEAVVKRLADSAIDGMVEIEWEGDRYATFAVDLEERCETSTV